MNSFKFRHFGIPSSIEEATSISTLSSQELESFASKCRLNYSFTALALTFILLTFYELFGSFFLRSIFSEQPTPRLLDFLIEFAAFAFFLIISLMACLSILSLLLRAFQKRDIPLSSISHTRKFLIPDENTKHDTQIRTVTACEAALFLIERHSLSSFRNKILSHPREFTLFDLDCLYYIHQFIPTDDELRLKSACKKLHLQN